MNREEIIGILRTSGLFGEADQQVLEHCAQRMSIERFVSGQVIVTEGTVSDRLYLLGRGLVEVKKATAGGVDKTLNYLLPGTTFGEVGVLENRPRGATVEALTDVVGLVLSREDFLALLGLYPSISLGLSRQLARYLIDANQRLTSTDSKAKVVVIFDILACKGATSIGMLLAQSAAAQPGSKVVYTEYPDPQKLLTELDITLTSRSVSHPSGYDLLVSHDDPNLPIRARTKLMLDQLVKEYDYVFLTVNESLSQPDKQLDCDVGIILEKADQVLILTPPGDEMMDKVRGLKQELQDYISHRKTNILTLANAYEDALGDVLDDFDADLKIPFLTDFPEVVSHLLSPTAPLYLQGVLDEAMDRLQRAHQVAVYVPSTIGVDHAADTSKHVDGVMAFMAELFGGATRRRAHGVWNSDSVGLVSEEVTIIYSHVTLDALNQHMNSVVAYITNLKKELKQEAMALEVDNKLTLI